MKKKKFKLYLNSIKYQNKKQLFYRIKYIAKNFFKKKIPNMYNNHIYNKKTNLKVNNICFFSGLTSSKETIEFDKEVLDDFKKKYEDISNNSFTFLNQTHRFEKEIDWQTNIFDDLWFFNLHYFDYLIDLGLYYNIKKDKKIYNLCKQMVLDWINNNEPASKSWHSYVISLRVVNWIKFYFLFKTEINKDDDFKDELLNSIYLQLTVLYNNLEYHLGGNHLLENGKTLIFGGLLFADSESDRWFKKGIEIIKNSIDNQILSDGGHYERSPMYHSIVLKDYLEIIHLLNNNNIETEEFDLEKINKMVDFLQELTQPDGEISLFNDSAFSAANSPSSLFLLAEAVLGYSNFNCNIKNDLYTYLLTGKKINKVKSNYNQKKLKSFSESGYYRISDSNEDNYLIFDCGNIGPDENPGHAHADTLSYEFSYKKTRWIVDSGTYSYHNDMRNKFRSTKAHNTIVVDDENQSKIWSKFRVGARAKAKTNLIIDNKNLTAVQGEHDGYKPIIHRRTLLFVKDQYWIILDKIKGSGKHHINNYIHLADNIKIDKIKEDIYLSSFQDKKLFIKTLDNDKFVKDSFYYSKEFNKKIKNDVLIQKKHAVLPLNLGYLLIPGDFYYNNSFLSFSYTDNLFSVEFDNFIDKIEIDENDINFERNNKGPF